MDGRACLSRRSYSASGKGGFQPALVVAHYDGLLGLELSDANQADLVAYLASL